mmetsp:Transcript_26145/g.54918  ORF Transcript_26145/g.54918 Transcript_26145/m.54918 type:complete len:277 (+) Transcript_26145:342-1172(+)|eukprot:3254222-Pleurochrysis_carterae.AAC.2
MDVAVEVSPQELTFSLVIGRKAVQYITVRHFGSHTPVTFKVKTTSPRRYVVQPTYGIVHPQSVERVAVTLRAQSRIPPDIAACEDRFKVYLLALTAAEEKTLRNGPEKAILGGLWGHDADANSSVYKVRCSLVLPESLALSTIIPEETSPNKRWPASPETFTTTKFASSIVRAWYDLELPVAEERQCSCRDAAPDVDASPIHDHHANEVELGSHRLDFEARFCTMYNSTRSAIPVHDVINQDLQVPSQLGLRKRRGFHYSSPPDTDFSPCGSICFP